jgi:hypothetical protein
MFDGLFLVAFERTHLLGASILLIGGGAPEGVSGAGVV